VNVALEPSIYRVIVTGSRETSAGQDAYVSRILDSELHPAVPGPALVIVHGGAKGVDAAANRWGRGRPGVTVEEHPADWELHGRLAGPVRNRIMAERGAALCLAFPSDTSRGTWNCVKVAAEYGIRIRVFPLPPTDWTP